MGAHGANNAHSAEKMGAHGANNAHGARETRGARDIKNGCVVRNRFFQPFLIL